MPRPINPKVQSRLLSLGAELVRANGFNATGVQEITAAAGVPKGSFYNYFDSKEAFAVAILDEYWTAIVDKYGPRLRESALGPRARIAAFFEGLAAFHAQHGFSLGCLVGNLALEVSGSSEEARAKLVGIFRDWSSMLSDSLSEAEACGEIRRGVDRHELARALIDAFEGAVLRAKVERDGAPFRRFQDLVLPSLLR
jgi:TetR/AcrR family transcriptional repressor of nem operon